MRQQAQARAREASAAATALDVGVEAGDSEAQSASGDDGGVPWASLVEEMRAAAAGARVRPSRRAHIASLTTSIAGLKRRMTAPHACIRCSMFQRVHIHTGHGSKVNDDRAPVVCSAHCRPQ